MMETIEIKYADFQTVSHQTSFPSPVDSDQIIYETACKLFDETWNRSPVRLLGIRTAKLVQTSEPVQLTLFDLTQPERFEKQHKLNEAIDTIRKKYGEKAIVRGSLLSKNNEFQKH